MILKKEYLKNDNGYHIRYYHKDIGEFHNVISNWEKNIEE